MTLAAYELDAIGFEGQLEAVTVHHFDSEECRKAWISKQVIPTSIGDNDDVIDGEVCEYCGGPL